MMRRLALFDLDHTLIPFDSGMAWTRFLVDSGRLPADAERRYLDFCHQYVAGTLDIRAMHRASVAPLASHTTDEVRVWVRHFQASMAARIPADRLARVQAHQQAGDLCAIVTATSSFVAEPFARLFGVNDLLATQPAQHDGSFNGEIAGEPCFREHKLSHVHAWLAQRGARLEDFDETWFYSDSASDLPLLSAVTHPVAVCPDARLRAHALERRWPVIDD
jgi:HAD superfamily hydrolase (TIGR01490 family)